MNAVSIGTIFWSNDLHSIYFDIPTFTDHYMEHLTIERRQACDDNVVRVANSKCLLAHKHKKLSRVSIIYVK
jgi:hypothetical protein